MEIINKKNFVLSKLDGQYIISWSRGKENLIFPITKELRDKALKSDKDGLEVMFYAENKRWPKDEELTNFNKTDVITYKGNGFVIYEENGNYEIKFSSGDLTERQLTFPITKELRDKALKSDKDALEVMDYLVYNTWEKPDPDKIGRQFLRQHPELIFKNYEANKALFSREEFEKLTRSVIGKLEPSIVDYYGMNNNNLELILPDETPWDISSEYEHLSKLQDKLNHYISFIENKQYIDKYNGPFDSIIIKAGFKYLPTKNGMEFLNKAKKIIEAEGIIFDIILPE
ncbi:hypothetical protein GPZ88_05540 [Streptococcus ruminicola]|jgi:hypothetical protein|uniref:Uncharacterized protein n=1 Tax=Streptococcus ruminicola TaxID=2686210 RepID=A0A6G8I0A9_9STRE|nr:DUF6572 domain-containing protein [Streptococcus ruminicola]QGZ28295.1 hypothetical protein GP482_09315 [Streptococcus ruminicola]QIM46530.1 hypothetical protein GPZ88_05540 [Streptococcus ruminicola]